MGESVLLPLRSQPYPTLVERFLNAPQVQEITTSSGTWYQVEVEAFWDNKKRSRDLRVMACVDDGAPGRSLCVDFIMASDGSFVGE